MNVQDPDSFPAGHVRESAHRVDAAQSACMAPAVGSVVPQRAVQYVPSLRGVRPPFASEQVIACAADAGVGVGAGAGDFGAGTGLADGDGDGAGVGVGLAVATGVGETESGTGLGPVGPLPPHASAASPTAAITSIVSFLVISHHPHACAGTSLAR